MRLFLRTAFVIGAIALVRKLLDTEAQPRGRPSRSTGRGSGAAKKGRGARRIADGLSASTAIADGEVMPGGARAGAQEGATIAVAAPSLRRKRPLPKMDQ